MISDDLYLPLSWRRDQYIQRQYETFTADQLDQGVIVSRSVLSQEDVRRRRFWEERERKAYSAELAAVGNDTAAVQTPRKA